MARARQDLDGALRRNTELQEEVVEGNHRLDAAAAEHRALEERLSETSASGAGLETALEQAEAGRAEAVAAADDLRVRLREASAEASGLRAQLADSKESCGVLSASVAEAIESRGAAAAEAARLQAEVSKTSEDCVALLQKAGDAAAARLGEVSAARDGLERRVGELEARLERAGEERRAEAALREVESSRLHGVLSDIERDHAEGNRTAAELRRGLADIHGIGAKLGERLISAVSERHDAVGRLGVCEGALAAEAAHRRRLELGLEESEAAVNGLKKEKEDNHRKMDELQKVGDCVRARARACACFFSCHFSVPACLAAAKPVPVQSTTPEAF